MGAVLNLLDSKGRDVLTVSPDTSVRDAIEKIEDISRSQIQKMIIQGQVTVNGKKPSKHHFLKIVDLFVANRNAP